MPSITTFITFNNQAEDAARFYTSIFPNSRITQVMRYPELGPEFPYRGGDVMMVAFELDGRPFLALNGSGGSPEFKHTHGISISVVCQTQEEVDRYWDRLSEGGTPVACGWIVDKFGVSWQINPALLIEMITDPDPRKAAKAMGAMMTMVKIDSDQLKQALAT